MIALYESVFVPHKLLFSSCCQFNIFAVLHYVIILRVQRHYFYDDTIKC